MRWSFFAVLLLIAPCFGDSGRIGTVTGFDGKGEAQQLALPGEEKTLPVHDEAEPRQSAGPGPSIQLSSTEVYHHQILEVIVHGLDNADPGLLTMQVRRSGKPFKSYGMLTNMPFRRSGSSLRAVYLPGWNEIEGDLEVVLLYDGKELQTNQPLGFELKRRPVTPIDGPKSVVNLEMNASIRSRKMVNPAGETTGYTAFLDWAEFMQADMLWILSGETTGFQPRAADQSPWDRGPLENLELLKKEAPSYGIEIGAYVMSYFVPGKHGVPLRYRPGIGYNVDKDQLYRGRHISLGSERRVQDLIGLVRSFQQDPDIQYIGFDFIRTGPVDGYEMVDEMAEDTNLATPAGWKEMSREQRIKWFARKIKVDRDRHMIEQWRWWRAHRVAGIVERVMQEAGVTKPVWVFTLGWDHGREHGQDPVMFFDAGVSIDSVMLYEATRAQFDNLLRQWNRYIREGQGNIFVGNCVDNKLLDSEMYSAPDEFFVRNVEGFSRVVRGGTAAGIFFHDLARAMWGRRGGHSAMEYALAHLASVHALKQTTLDLELIAEIVPHAEGGQLNLKNNSTIDLRNIEVKVLHPEVHLGEAGTGPTKPRALSIERLKMFESVSIPFVLPDDPDRKLIRFSIVREGGEDYLITVIWEGPERIATVKSRSAAAPGK
jgi:hypothetical protein